MDDFVATSKFTNFLRLNSVIIKLKSPYQLWYFKELKKATWNNNTRQLEYEGDESKNIHYIEVYS